jgi:hypothetical protein
MKFNILEALERNIGERMRPVLKTNRRNETLFERCGTDRVLYLSCKAVVEGAITPFIVGNLNAKNLLNVDRKMAAEYIAAYKKEMNRRDSDVKVGMLLVESAFA